MISPLRTGTLGRIVPCLLRGWLLARITSLLRSNRGAEVGVVLLAVAYLDWNATRPIRSRTAITGGVTILGWLI